jgi:hypothetical protein
MQQTIFRIKRLELDQNMLSLVSRTSHMCILMPQTGMRKTKANNVLHVISISNSTIIVQQGQSHAHSSLLHRV